MIARSIHPSMRSSAWYAVALAECHLHLQQVPSYTKMQAEKKCISEY